MSVQLGPRRDVVGVGAIGIVFVERNSGVCNRLEEERRSNDGARERKEDANIPMSWVLQPLPCLLVDRLSVAPIESC
jgi:hypothetical protein